jgi:hypothetical protein
MEEDENKNKEEVLEGNMNITVKELIEKDIYSKYRRLVDHEAKALKEVELKSILDSLETQWNVSYKFKATTQNEIETPDKVFDEIDDTFAKVAEISSNK